MGSEKSKTSAGATHDRVRWGTPRFQQDLFELLSGRACLLQAFLCQTVGRIDAALHPGNDFPGNVGMALAVFRGAIKLWGGEGGREQRSGSKRRREDNKLKKRSEQELGEETRGSNERVT